MSEKPTSVSREARRKTVGEVVTVLETFLQIFVVGTGDYSLRARLVQVEAILLRKCFK